MTASDALLISIPTYNERENIGPLLPALLGLHPDAHVLVVDDKDVGVDRKSTRLNSSH